MDDLVEWLRAQLDDDERAVAAILRQRPNWRVDPQPWDAGGVGVLDDRGDGVAIVRGDYAAEHIARHDPARVLRDVEAQRKRLAFIERLANHTDSPEDSFTTISMNALRTVAVNELLWAEVLPYSDRPGYREEWRP